MAEWPLQSGLTLTAMPNAAYWARRHVADVLVKWRLSGLDGGDGVSESGSLVETVCLVVSELVTNAVKATGGLSAEGQAQYKEEPLSVPYTELAGLGCVRLRLSYDRICLLVKVWDKSEEPPVVAVPELEDEGGRGLFLVGALSERWGWYPAEKGGKVVWAAFPVAAAATTTPAATGPAEPR